MAYGSHSLSHRRQFEAVYKARTRAFAGPLVVWGAPNDVGRARLGLAVPRRVGTAVRRNRIKRLLRESFRLLSPDGGYDLVISVRPHEPLRLAEYQAALTEALVKIRRTWERRDGAMNGASDADDG